MHDTLKSFAILSYLEFLFSCFSFGNFATTKPFPEKHKKELRTDKYRYGPHRVDKKYKRYIIKLKLKMQMKNNRGR